MNGFDVAIVHFLNQFAQKSWGFDELMSHLGANAQWCVIIVAFIWWAWFSKTEHQRLNREYLLSGLAMTFVALFAARALAIVLPFRQRPLWNPAMHFVPPFGDNPSDLVQWSSFPSDHATFFFALATCLFFVSKKVGSFSYLYAFFVICLTRIYKGEHYPTDILVGAMLGIGIVFLARFDKVRQLIARPALRFADDSPGGFYAVFFTVSIMFAMEFEPVRPFLYSAWRGLHRII